MELAQNSPVSTLQVTKLAQFHQRAAMLCRLIPSWDSVTKRAHLLAAPRATHAQYYFWICLIMALYSWSYYIRILQYITVYNYYSMLVYCTNKEYSVLYMWAHAHTICMQTRTGPSMPIQYVCTYVYTHTCPHLGQRWCHQLVLDEGCQHAVAHHHCL